MKKNNFKKLFSFFNFFTSFSTLLCCTIPAVLSLIASSAVIGVYVTAFPWLIPFSKYKTPLFIVTGILLTINFIVLKKKPACDVENKEICEETGKWSYRIYIISVLLYSLGVLFSYVIPWVWGIFI